MWNRTKTGAIDSTAKLSGIVILATMVSLLFAFPVTAHDHDEPGTSIKVHGDWVITVTNPDGSIAQESSFQNALMSPGALVGLLVGQDNLGTDDVWHSIATRASGSVDWHIEVTATGVNSVSDCDNLLFVDRDGIISGLDSAEASISAVTSSSFTLTRNLSLPINCVSDTSYAITGVGTALAGFIISGGSGFAHTGVFTAKTLAAPITGILPDQVVTLKATISFQ